MLAMLAELAMLAAEHWDLEAVAAEQCQATDGLVANGLEASQPPASTVGAFPMVTATGAAGLATGPGAAVAASNCKRQVLNSICRREQGA